jgi:hypothetical protein
MSDYSPISVTEKDVRNFVTPPLDYDDVSKAEILLKIESVETFVKRVYFGGGTIPSDGRIAILLLIVSNLIATPSLAKKYRTLASESLGDYSYTISQPMSRGSAMQSDPFTVIKTWHTMATEILNSLISEDRIKLYKVND